MNGAEVQQALADKGVSRIFHANSVKTSLSLLKLGGLASRAKVETSGLAQTNQISDDIDRKYNIWNDIFMDSVDIHERISDRNHYGPVLFGIDLGILGALPSGSEVFVTKKNPTKWKSSDSQDDRYYNNVNDIHGNVIVGDFDHMLVVRHSSGLVRFDDFLRDVILDVPVSGGGGEYFEKAKAALEKGLKDAGLSAAVTARSCSYCRCNQSYAMKSTRIPWFYSVG